MPVRCWSRERFVHEAKEADLRSRPIDRRSRLNRGYLRACNRIRVGVRSDRCDNEARPAKVIGILKADPQVVETKVAQAGHDVVAGHPIAIRGAASAETRPAKLRLVLLAIQCVLKSFAF